MRSAQDARGSSARPRAGLIASTGLLSLFAGGVAYAGLAIALSVARANGDPKAVAAGAGYASGAFGVPIAAGVYLARSRGWSGLRAVRFAAGVSLTVHAVLVPIALAALAM